MADNTSPRPSAGQQDNPYYGPPNTASSMNNHDELQRPQRYPSPDAVHMGQGGGPFYSNQNRVSPIDNLTMSAQLARSAAPLMAPSMSDGHEMDSRNMVGDGLPVNQASPHPMDPDGVAPNRDAGVDDATAPRKRSKTSRACDECRRKKIRCDAKEEGSTEACTNCKRVNAKCLFSRVPQKRGPSKGYIKELADRLNVVEERQQAAQHPDMQYGVMDDGMSPRQPGGFTPPPYTAANPRKRTHSVSEGFTNVNFSQERQTSVGGWSTQAPLRHIPHPVPGLPHPHGPQNASSGTDLTQTHSGSARQYSPNGMLSIFWRRGLPGDGRRDSVGIPDETGTTRLSEQELVNVVLDWDERVVDEYYRIIHPTFPILHGSKLRLKGSLAGCPAAMKDAFLEALDLAVRSSSSANVSSISELQGVGKTMARLNLSQLENTAKPSLSACLLHVQTLILLMLAADQYGPATMSGQLGPSSDEILGAAYGFMQQMKLLHAVPHIKRCSDGDLDSNEILARRAWWVLVVIDQWHACSTPRKLLIHDTGEELTLDDRAILGESAYLFARLSNIAGHLASIIRAAKDELPSRGGILDMILRGELAQFCSTMDTAMSQYHLIHTAYWHVKLLAQRHMSFTKPHELLGPAHELVTLLNSTSTSVAPLFHHFTALAALTFVELTDYPETQDGAWKGIQLLSQQLGSAHEDSLGWDSAIRDFIARKEHQNRTDGVGPMSSTSRNLQDLAEIAVRESGKAEASNASGDAAIALAQTHSDPKQNSFDPTLLTKQGYLSALG